MEVFREPYAWSSDTESGAYASQSDAESEFECVEGAPCEVAEDFEALDEVLDGLAGVIQRVVRQRQSSRERPPTQIIIDDEADQTRPPDSPFILASVIDDQARAIQRAARDRLRSLSRARELKAVNAVLRIQRVQRAHAQRTLARREGGVVTPEDGGVACLPIAKQNHPGRGSTIDAEGAMAGQLGEARSGSTWRLSFLRQRRRGLAKAGNKENILEMRSSTRMTVQILEVPN